MNAKLAIAGIAITLAVIFGAAFLLSKPEVKAEVRAENSGKLTADESFNDFGTISMAKGVVSKKFTVKNTDNKTAMVTKMFTSCMCTKAKLIVGDKSWGPYGMPGHGGPIPNIAAEIPAGGESEVEVTFDPAAHGPAGIGRVERTVTLQLNGQNPIILGFRANVTP